MREEAEPAPAPRMGVAASLAMYGGGAALLWVAIRFSIPWLVSMTGVEPVVAWFVAAGAGMLLPLVAAAWLILAAEGAPSWRRLWLRPMNRGDWASMGLGALAITVLTAPILWLLLQRYGRDVLSPDFLTFNALTRERMWILAAWLPFFAINMLGEAFVWHAVMLPRQEQTFGRFAWLVSGAGWALVHIAMPWQIIVLLAPTLAVIPFVVQRRRNVWIGVALHMLVNGPGFLAVAFGLA